MKKGKLFVIEGLDGSGKQTQSQLLFKRLKKEKYNIRYSTYPNYKSDSSALVKMYLNGDFGTNPEEISPYISSSFFAVDRYATYKKEFEDFYLSGGIILSDRYTTSNMVHQASKIKDKKEKEDFISWLWNLEFNIYKIPIPTQVFFLNVSEEYSWNMMKKRKNKITNENKKDIHESDFNYLKHSYENAKMLIEKYGWINIECIQNDKMKSIEEINEQLYKEIIKYL